MCSNWLLFRRSWLDDEQLRFWWKKSWEFGFSSCKENSRKLKARKQGKEFHTFNCWDPASHIKDLHSFLFSFFFVNLILEEFLVLFLACNYEKEWCKSSTFFHINGGGNWAGLQVSTHAAQTTMRYKLMKI